MRAGQRECGHIVQMLAQIEEPRSPKTVNGLIRVAEHQHVGYHGGHGLNGPKLRAREILKLIDEDVLVAGFDDYLWMIPQQTPEQGKGSIKIHHTSFPSSNIVVSGKRRKLFLVPFEAFESQCQEIGKWPAVV